MHFGSRTWVFTNGTTSRYYFNNERVGGGLIIVMWSANRCYLGKGYTCVFFPLFCNSENKKKASVRLKCNGVQFKCNTVNSKKEKKQQKTKTASSYFSTKKRPKSFSVFFHALLEILFFCRTCPFFFFFLTTVYICVWQNMMPLCQNGIKQFLYIRKCCHEHIFAEIRLRLFNMVSNEAFYYDTDVRKTKSVDFWKMAPAVFVIQSKPLFSKKISWILHV